MKYTSSFAPPSSASFPASPNSVSFPKPPSSRYVGGVAGEDILSSTTDDIFKARGLTRQSGLHRAVGVLAQCRVTTKIDRIDDRRGQHTEVQTIDSFAGQFCQSVSLGRSSCREQVQVVASTSQHGIITRSANQCVLTSTDRERVVARSAVQSVARTVASQRYFPRITSSVGHNGPHHSEVHHAGLHERFSYLHSCSSVKLLLPVITILGTSSKLNPLLIGQSQRSRATSH